MIVSIGGKTVISIVDGGVDVVVVVVVHDAWYFFVMTMIHRSHRRNNVHDIKWDINESSLSVLPFDNS